MLVLSAGDVKKALPMKETIEAMKSAYAALSNGQADVPLRVRLPVPAQDGVSLFMPARVDIDHEQALGIKVVSVFPNNSSKNLPMIHAAVMILDAGTGQILSVMEGGSLTAIRTGAGCGAAADLLARPGSKTAGIFGAGVLARTILEAICTVRPIETVWIYGPTAAKVEALIAELAGKGPIPTDLRAAASPAEVVREADIVAAATTAAQPVFDYADLKPGAHVNAAGSYTPEMQEVPSQVITEGLVTVDSRPAVLAESGDLIQPIRAGLFTQEQIYAEIGEIVSGAKPRPELSGQTTYFKSVGVAVQDAAAGRLALMNAEKLGLGQQVSW